MKRLLFLTLSLSVPALIAVIAHAHAATAQDIVDRACDNRDLIVKVLAWIGGVAPVASIVAWLTARYSTLPPWAQSILQVLSANLLHALAGEPEAAARKAAARRALRETR